MEGGSGLWHNHNDQRGLALESIIIPSHHDTVAPYHLGLGDHEFPGSLEATSGSFSLLADCMGYYTNSEADFHPGSDDITTDTYGDLLAQSAGLTSPPCIFSGSELGSPWASVSSLPASSPSSSWGPQTWTAASQAVPYSRPEPVLHPPMAPQIPGASVPATLLTEHPTVSSPAITCPSVEPYGFSLRSHKARTRIKDRVLGSLEPERTRAFRAYHREVGTKGRLREREEKERIESATRDLEDLNADLIAQEKALTEEKLALKEELFRHAAYCNDSAISDYLTYTAKEIVEKAKTQYYKDRPCCCQR